MQRALDQAWQGGAGAGSRAQHHAIRACIEAAHASGCPRPTRTLARPRRPADASRHPYQPQALDRRSPIARPLPPELLEQLGADPHAPPNPDRVQPYEQPHDPPAPDLAEDLGDSRPSEASRP